MTKALKKAKKMSYQGVVAESYTRNVPAHKLLEKFGFSKVYTYSVLKIHNMPMTLTLKSYLVGFKVNIYFFKFWFTLSIIIYYFILLNLFLLVM